MALFIAIAIGFNWICRHVYSRSYWFWLDYSER